MTLFVLALALYIPVVLLLLIRTFIAGVIEKGRATYPRAIEALADDLMRAVRDYQRRDRRFGAVSEEAACTT